MPSPAPRIDVALAVSLAGMACADIGSEQEAVLKAALVTQLGGAADESHFGDLSCGDARRRLDGAAAGRTRSSSSSSTRRALGSAGSSVTISVDAEVEMEVSYTADDDGATTADIAALVIAAVQSALTAETVRSSALLDSIADAAAAADFSASFASIVATGVAAASALAPTPEPTPEPTPFDWGRDEEPWHPVFGTDPHADCLAALPPGSAHACAAVSAATAVGGGSGARVASLWPSGTLRVACDDTAGGGGGDAAAWSSLAIDPATGALLQLCGDGAGGAAQGVASAVSLTAGAGDACDDARELGTALWDEGASAESGDGGGWGGDAADGDDAATRAGRRQLFYTDGRAIRYTLLSLAADLASAAESSHAATALGDELVGSYGVVSLEGAHFGDRAAALLEVTVRGVSCASLHWTSSTAASCVLTEPSALSAEVTADYVTLTVAADATATATARGRTSRALCNATLAEKSRAPMVVAAALVRTPGFWPSRVSYVCVVRIVLFSSFAILSLLAFVSLGASIAQCRAPPRLADVGDVA